MREESVVVTFFDGTSRAFSNVASTKYVMFSSENAVPVFRIEFWSPDKTPKYVDMPVSSIKSTDFSGVPHPQEAPAGITTTFTPDNECEGLV